MKSAPLPRPGDVLLGKYKIERVLGRGGSGIVMEASHLVLDRRFAIKLLQPDRVTGQGVARLLREARIAANLDSDRIVRVTDVGQTEHRIPYLVMDLLDGRDLGAELKARGPHPIEEAVDLVLEACAGVAAAHAVGLVHRDLKPANLFLASRPNRRPKLKVLDFGLTKAPTGEASGSRAEFRSLTGTAAVFGTAPYMSPEQIESTKNVDARTDQHALAVVLWELLVGSSPFTRPTALQIAVAIANEMPPPVRKRRPDAPPELDAAIARALAKNREDRFPDLRAFAAAIAPFGSPRAARLLAEVENALATTGRDSIYGDDLVAPRVPSQEAPIAEPRGVAMRWVVAIAAGAAAVGAGAAVLVMTLLQFAPASAAHACAGDAVTTASPSERPPSSSNAPSVAPTAASASPARSTRAAR